MLKLALCVIIPMIITTLNYMVEKSFVFIAKSCCVVNILFIIGYIVDSLWFGWIDCFGDFVVIYHLAYTLISMGTVLATCILINLYSKNHNNDFAKSYHIFFMGFFLTLCFIFVLIYFVLRQYSNEQSSVNLILFNGEIKNVITTGEQVIRFVGNILFYTALLLAFVEIYKKHSLPLAFITTVVLSVACEIFEYVSASGDLDIDDIFTNVLGSLIGVVIYKTVIKKLLTVKE